MKLKNVLYFIGFIVIFTIAVYYSYKTFYPTIVDSIQKNQKVVNFNQISNGIYFESNHIFFIANAETTANRLFSPDRVQINTQNYDAAIFENSSTPTKTINTNTGSYFLKADTANNQNSSNIYFTGNQDNQTKIITNITFPLTITDFNLASDNTSIVYTVTDVDTLANDIIICKADGTNSLKLTDDGLSSFPVFSPDNTKIAFWQKDSGFYIINTDKSSKVKILNFDQKIDQIFAWR